MQTEFVPEVERAAGDAPAAVRDGTASLGGPRRCHRRQVRRASSQYETDRARFLGRGRSRPDGGRGRRRAAALEHRRCGPRSDLQPPLRVRLAPGQTVHAIFSTVVAESRDEVLDLVDKYREPATFERAATLAWTQAQVQLHHLGIEPDEAHLFQRLANRILYSDPSLRPAPGLLAQNRRGARGLWAHGISGDLPIVVVRIDEAEDLDIVRQLLRAHEYWRLKLLDVDLVILNEHGASYAHDLRARWRRSSGRASRASSTRAREHAAASTCCAATGSRPRTGPCSRRPRGSSC